MTGLTETFAQNLQDCKG